MNVLDELTDFYYSYTDEKGYIGSTENGRLIPYFVVKKTASPIILLQYAIHAREYITTYLAIEQIKDFIKNGTIGTAYFVPAVNIDGIEIALNKKPLYKANARSVDLNVNFDALWGKGESNEVVKGDQNYIGTHPFSERESKSLRDFTLNVMPDMTVSYHSKGEEIYYEFFQTGKRLERDFVLAKSVADVTGYAIKSTLGSCGGYKDWCIDKLKIPSLTIEVGNDCLTHPIKKRSLGKIYKKNKRVVTTLMQKLLEIKCN